MNENFWKTGILESSAGPIAWPGMHRSDVENLAPVLDYKGDPIDGQFQTRDVQLDGRPFLVQFLMPRSDESQPIYVRLFLADGRERYGEEFPIRQELNYYESLFQRHLGSAEHEHRLAWGNIKIGYVTPWFQDRVIDVCYKRRTA